MRTIALLVLVALAFGCSSRSAAPSVGGAIVLPQVVETGNVGSWQTFPNPEGSAIYAMTPGKDGAIWFVDSRPAIGRISMSGQETLYPLSAGASFNNIDYDVGICRNPDGNVYFTEELNGGPAIGKITPQGVITDIPLQINSGEIAQTITSSTAGNLWVGHRPSGGLTHVVVGGSQTDYALPISPYGLVLGPDGRLWMAAGSTVYAMTQSGVLSTYQTTIYPSYYPHLLISAFGSLWMAQPGYGFAQMATDGSIQYFPLSPALSKNFGPVQLVAGRGGMIYWASVKGLKRYSTISHLTEPEFTYPDGLNHSLRFISTMGPDANIWIPTDDGTSPKLFVYIFRTITPSPTSIVVSVNGSAPLSASETYFTKSLSAVSNDPSIAKVVATTKDSWTVTGIAAGSTTITVSDTIGNSLDVPVTVQ